MAVNKTWIGTDGNYAANGNWSPANVPVATDHVRLPAGGGSISSGLNQSAVAIGDFIIEAGYAGLIGTSAANLQMDPDRFIFEGQGLAYIDIGAAAIDLLIRGTASASEGYRGLYLKGTAIDELAIESGSVGLAFRHGEASQATTIRLLTAQADLIAGAGCTLTSATLQMLAGIAKIRASLGTMNLYGGNLETQESMVLTAGNVYGGTFIPNSTGNITTLILNGGTTDFNQLGLARTVPTLKHNRGTLIYDPATLTITTRSAPDYPLRLVASAA
jgi:hypothetical protein